MKNLSEEINLFLYQSSFAPGTISMYKNPLNDFLNDIAEICETNKDELHLLKIYIQLDNNGEFLCYKPIDAELIEHFLVRNMGKKSRYWLRAVRQALSSFFTYLSRKYDFNNIIDQISFKAKDFKGKQKPIKILSRHQLLKLFHCIIKYSDNLDEELLLFIILISTGARISEVLNLNVEDIYWDEGTALLNKTKNKKNRLIIFRDGLSESIRIYSRKYEKKDKEKLFNLSYTEVGGKLKYYLQMSNLPEVNIHSLRHTFATLMYESKGDITVIQQILDHRDLYTTKGYIHPNYIRNEQIKIKENEELYSDLKKLI